MRTAGTGYSDKTSSTLSYSPTGGTGSAVALMGIPYAAAGSSSLSPRPIIAPRFVQLMIWPGFDP